MSDKNIQTLGALMAQLGDYREVVFDGRRYNSKHLSNLLEKWKDSQAYTTEHGIKFDVGEGQPWARIVTGVVK